LHGNESYSLALQRGDDKKTDKGHVSTVWGKKKGPVCIGFSDSSNSGYGGLAVSQGGVCSDLSERWTDVESSKDNTWKEFAAVELPISKCLLAMNSLKIYTVHMTGR